MYEISLHPVSDAVRKHALLDNDAYLRLYQQNVEPLASISLPMGSWS